MSPSVHIRLSTEILVHICSVDGGSKRCDFQFVCVGKEVCTVLSSVNLFQGFALLV